MTHEQEVEVRQLKADIDDLERQLRALKEAISPGRVGGLNYYIGVAQRMREKELKIKTDWSPSKHGRP